MNDVNSLKTVLLLAANPKGTPPLRLQEEEREIRQRLRLAGFGKEPIQSVGATRWIDVLQAMTDFEPRLVHFSGHGAGQSGLVFEDVLGQEHLVSSETLSNLFKLFSEQVECVILNACHTQVQAEEIAKHVRYVTGTSQGIDDRAAIEFSRGFYTAWGAGKTVEFSYELGCNAIQGAGVPGHLTTVLYKEGKLIHSQTVVCVDNSTSRSGRVHIPRDSEDHSFEIPILDSNLLKKVIGKIRRHLGEQVSGRDTEEALAELLTREFGYQNQAAKIVQQLKLEGYLSRQSGNRLELTPKSNTIR
jgi:CHAT domain